MAPPNNTYGVIIVDPTHPVHRAPARRAEPDARDASRPGCSGRRSSAAPAQPDAPRGGTTASGRDRLRRDRRRRDPLVEPGRRGRGRDRRRSGKGLYEYTKMGERYTLDEMPTRTRASSIRRRSITIFETIPPEYAATGLPVAGEVGRPGSRSDGADATGASGAAHGSCSATHRSWASSLRSSLIWLLFGAVDDDDKSSDPSRPAARRRVRSSLNDDEPGLDRLGPDAATRTRHGRGPAHLRAAVRRAVHGRQRRRDRAGRHRRHDHDRAVPGAARHPRADVLPADRVGRVAATPSSRPSSSTSTSSRRTTRRTAAT